jgi:hypothetical protein
VNQRTGVVLGLGLTLVGSTLAQAGGGHALTARPALHGEQDLVPEDHRAGPSGQESRFDASVAVSPASAQGMALGYTTATAPYGARVATSADGGVSWQPTSALPLPHGAPDAGETSVAFSGNRLVVTYLAFRTGSGQVDPSYAGGLLVVTSRDLGKHWSRPTTLQAASGTCGRFPTEPAVAGGSGLVAITWINQEGGGNCQRPYSLAVALSADGGATWRVRSLPYQATSYYGLPAVAVSGREVVVTARRDCNSFSPIAPPRCRAEQDVTADLVAYYSGDGGRVFAAPVDVASDFGIDRGAVAFDAKRRTILAIATPYSSNPVSQATLETEDQAWLSADRGRTWHRRADPFSTALGGTAPSLVAAGDGSTMVLLVDVQGPLRAGAVPVLVTSQDDAATWSCPRMLATQPRPWSSSYSTRTGLAVGTGIAHPVWPDNREYPPGPTETLYTTSVPVPQADAAPGCAALAALPGVAEGRARTFVPIGLPR